MCVGANKVPFNHSFLQLFESKEEKKSDTISNEERCSECGDVEIINEMEDVEHL